MLITGIKTNRITTDLKRPFKTALRTLDSIESILIEINTDYGRTGYGGASPTAVITGDTVGSIKEGVQIIADRIIGLDIANLEIIMQRINSSLVGNTSAKAAVDMAVYDLYGKLYSTPVYRLLGGFRNTLVTDLTISLNSPGEMVEESMEAVRQGAKTLKIADGINIKLMKSGGIYNAVKIADIAEAAGLFCMVGSIMESHAGLTAAAHLAASRAVIREVDLDVPLLCYEKKEKGGTEYHGTAITLPESPGLGIFCTNGFTVSSYAIKAERVLIMDFSS